MRTVDRGRAALSVVGLIGFVIGVPAILARVARARFGGPAPWHGVAPGGWTMTRFVDSFTNRLTEATIIDLVVRVALMTAWIGAAVVVVNVVLEVVHMRRHGGLPRPRVRGLAWSQRLARTLAAGLLVALPASTVGRVSARTALDAVRHSGTTAGQLVVQQVNTAPEVPRAVTDAGDEYVVAAGDSIYGIAERLAGDESSRIDAIATSLLDLNLGRTMPDGQRFLTAAYIEPGWTLHLPGNRAIPVAVGDSTSLPYVVAAGDTLTSIAADELDDAARWIDIWTENRGDVMPGGRTFDDPDLILPGWHLDLPDVVPPATVAAPTADEPTVADAASAAEDSAPLAAVVTHAAADVVTTVAPSATITPPTSAASTPPTRSTTSSTSTPPTTSSTTTAPALPIAEPAPQGASAASPSPVGIEHAAMLATGVLALVAARRRHRLRSAVPPARNPAPSDAGVAVERALRVADAAERFLRLDLAVRAAAETIADAGRRVLAASVGTSGVVALWTDGDVVLPAPWQRDGDVSILPGTVPVDDLTEAARRGGCPCVALVQVGVTPDGADVYVDLEAAGILSVEAPPEQADDVVAAIAVTLAASPLAEIAHLVDAGLPPAAFLGHRQHHRSVSVHDAVTAAISLVPARREASTFELRVRGTGGELWEPAVVFVPSARVSEADENATGAARAHAVALVAAGPVAGARMRLVARAEHWVIDPLGIELTPIGLAAGDVCAVAELVAESDRAVEPDRAASSEPVEVCHDPDRPGWPLMVRVLGPVDVVDANGTSAPFEKSKARELVAWLALHAERPTRTGARTALWDLDVRDATFANVVSEARRATARLVEPPADDAWIRRTLTEDLPLHPAIVTDAQLLADAIRTARALPGDHAVAVLEHGLELVRGMPFEGTSYLWPDAEGITSDLVLQATSAAVELARLHLERDDVDGVFRATGRGLRVLAGHEELIALRMRAHARRGDLAGVRHEWESYERVIHADPWSDGEPAPKLLDLRRELLTRPV